MRSTLFVLVIGLAIVTVSAAPNNAAQDASQPNASREPDVVYVPTPNDVVARMLELAKVGKDDIVYDLGCGDGRIVVTAAKKYGVKGIGIELHPDPVKMSRDNVQSNNVAHLVKIEQKDIFEVDLSQASVITLYLLPELNVKLIPQLEKLKPGSRIVSHELRRSFQRRRRTCIGVVRSGST